MSRGNQPGIGYIFAGLVAGIATFFTSTTVLAGDTAYFYCRKIQGNNHTDFALAVTGNNITLQPHTSLESPGVRIYHGKAVRVTPSGNILVDFNKHSMTQYLTPFPQVLVTPEIFRKGTQGYARIYNGGSNPSKDTIMLCEVKKIFY